MNNSKSTSVQPKKENRYPQKSTNVYENMRVLCKDLYYKSIVAAHASRITAETENTISDIMYKFNKGYISKRELFVELEALKSGYQCTDLPVKEIIKIIRAKK